MEFAIVPEDPTLQQDDPAWAHVVAALNIQAAQQAGPSWNVPVVVNSYARLELVPPMAVPVVIMRKPDNGVEGCHKWDGHMAGAIVRWVPDGAWSVAASHEIVETLVDPTLSSMRPGPDPGGSGTTVSFLVEVCDPCAGMTYPVLPGSVIEVSDYCLPAYFSENTYGPCTRCHQSIHLWTPEALTCDTGYITWSAADGWYQYFEGSIHGPVSEDVLLVNALHTGVRGAVDRLPTFAGPKYMRGSNLSTPAGITPFASQLSPNRRLAAWFAHIKEFDS